MTINHSAKSSWMRGLRRTRLASLVPSLLGCAGLLLGFGCAEGYPDPGQGTFAPQGVAATESTAALPSTPPANLQAPPAGLSANPSASPAPSPWTPSGGPNDDEEDTPTGVGLPLGSNAQPSPQQNPSALPPGGPSGFSGMPGTAGAQITTTAGDPAAAGATTGSSCQDGTLNGTETDVDCGGGCSPCATGGACVINADCAAGLFCDGSTCQAPPNQSTTQPPAPTPTTSSPPPQAASSFTCGGDSCNECGGGLTNCCTLLNHCGCSLLSNGRLCLLRPPLR